MEPNNEPKSETPETDKEAELGIGPRAVANGNAVSATFARQLERQRDQARRELDDTKASLESLANRLSDYLTTTDQLRARVGELEKDKERLDWLDSRAYKAEKFNDDRGEWWELHFDSAEIWKPTVRQAIDEVLRGKGP